MRRVLLILVIGLGTTSAITQAQETQPAEIRPFSLDSATMTDEWFGLGPKMEDMGIRALFISNHQYMSVIDGGLREKCRGDSATYDALISFDLDKMGVMKDADALVHARHQWNLNVNKFTGANQQVVDDADGDLGIYIDQLWLRKHFADRKIALRIGYLDYQTIVDHNAYANSEDKQFMNAALDNNPLVPTASAAGLGAALTIKPCDWYSVIFGAGDAQRLPLYKPGFSTTFHDEAWFLGYMEHGIHPTFESPNGPLKGNYRIGLVYDPTPRTKFLSPNQQSDRRGNNTSLYLSFDQMVFRENEKDNQGLGLFFRFSHVDDHVYRFDKFYSGGLSYTGLIPSRDKDVLGCAVAALSDSHKYRDRVNPNSGNETIYELYYAIHVAPWMVVSPDIQYVDNPGANDTISHAVVGGVRFRVIF